VASSLDPEFASLGVTSPSTTVDTRTEGWKVYAGYQLNDYLGVEGGYANLNDWTAHSSTSGGSYLNKGNADAWLLSAVGTIPLTNKFSVMGRLGAAYMLVDSRLTDLSNTSDTTTRTQSIGKDSYGAYYGVGVTYALLDNFKLRAEWERINGENVDTNLMTAGFAVQF
jgi:opacity protein-like surface antigen